MTRIILTWTDFNILFERINFIPIQCSCNLFYLLFFYSKLEFSSFCLNSVLPTALNIMPTDDEDQQQQGEEKPFAVERAKTGRAKCKKCKCPIEKDEIRIAKYVASFFSDGKLMPAWHHVACLFEVFAKQRASTKRIEDPAEDVKGWEQLSDDDKKIIQDKLEEFQKSCNYREETALSLHDLLSIFHHTKNGFAEVSKNLATQKLWK